MRISDWSSDVCSSDLRYYGEVTLRESFARSMNSVAVRLTQKVGPKTVAATARRLGITSELRPTDRKSVVSGKSGSVRVDLGGRRIINKKKHKQHVNKS